MNKAYKDLEEERRKAVEDLAASPYSEEAMAHEPDSFYFLGLKKKKPQAILRKALIDSGYGELLQNMSIKKGTTNG